MKTQNQNRTPKRNTQNTTKISMKQNALKLCWESPSWNSSFLLTTKTIGYLFIVELIRVSSGIRGFW